MDNLKGVRIDSIDKDNECMRIDMVEICTTHLHTFLVYECDNDTISIYDSFNKFINDTDNISRSMKRCYIALRELLFVNR